MNIEIMDRYDNYTSCEIDLDIIQEITILIYSGDEVLRLIHNNGYIEVIDSCLDARPDSYYEGEYTVFDRHRGIYLLDDINWLSRVNAYDFLQENRS